MSTNENVVITFSHNLKLVLYGISLINLKFRTLYFYDLGNNNVIMEMFPHICIWPPQLCVFVFGMN